MNVEMKQLRWLIIIVLLITVFIIIAAFMWGGMQGNLDQGITGFSDMMGINE